MPKYGNVSALYGNSANKYGTDGTNPSGELQWIFLVDWDNDNSFAHNEATYLIDLETTRGERYFVRPGGNGFEVMRPGEGTATLIDNTGRFDPDNASGPLYELILPGRKFRLMVKDLTSGVTYPVMAGFIYDIPPISEMDKIQLSLRESMSLLDRKVNIPILYRNSISEAINALVSNANWPASFGSLIDDEPQQVTTFTVDNINALDTILELGAAGLGQIFSDNTGKLKFYNRGHSTMASVAIDQAHALKQIRRSQPWENQRNIIQVIANKKLKAREAAIWQSGQPITIPASGSMTIAMTYPPAIDIRVYSLAVNTLVDFMGYNVTGGTQYINGIPYPITGQVTYTLTTYSKSSSITFTNPYAIPVYASIILTGRPIIDQPIMAEVTNALTTQTVFELDNPWMQDLSHAQAYATMISNFLDETQRTVELQIEQRPALQFSFDLMDKIPLTVAKLAINTTYYAGLIEHRWQSENGQSVVTTLVLRPRLTDATAITNDTEDPDLPYIPEPSLPPGGIPINIPTLPPSVPIDVDDPGGCLSNVSAPANGPYDLLLNPINLTSNASYFYNLYVGSVYARPAGFTNLSKIAITGDWLKWNSTTSQWDGDTATDWWNVTMNSSYLTKGTYTDGGTGTRILTIDLGGAQEISRLLFELDPDPGPGNISWSFGSNAEGWVFGEAKPGTGLGSTLANGYWEAGQLVIECPGWRQGSWSYTPDTPFAIGNNSTINVSVVIPGNSFTGVWIDYTDGVTPGTFLVDQTEVNTDFDISAYAGKMITKIWLNTVTFNNYIRWTSVVLTDVTGTFEPGKIYKWNIRQVSLYNVCPA